MEARTLTLTEAVELATVIGWAQRNARLRWLDDRGDIHEGTARSIGDDRGMFTQGADVRDCHLRITTAMGFEWFVPMSDVISRVHGSTMVAD